jgi:uncharacterized protein
MNQQIENFRRQILKYNILEKYHLEKITLFGSFARGEDFNDIDIFIENYEDYDKLIELKKELENIFNKPVDIIIKKYANPIILFRAQRDFIDVA